jgi:transposase
VLKTPLKDLLIFYKTVDYKVINKLNVPALIGLKETSKRISQDIKKLISLDPNLRKQVSLLLTIPGIGLITALYLIVFTNEFTRFKEGRKLACYIGVAPFEHSSGISVKGKSRIHKIANKTLKRLFHMGALSVIRCSKEFKDYFQRKVREGKNKRLVINAIRNKLALRVMAVINRGTPYDKIYYKTSKFTELIMPS